MEKKGRDVWKGIRLSLKSIATVIMLILIYHSMTPFSLGVFTIGSYLPIGVFGTILLVWYIPGLKQKIRSGKFGRILYRVFSILIAAGLCYSVLISSFILFAGNHTTEREDVTLVVLGCQVHGENPSLMLVTRLNAAKEYLDRHPGVPCVLSGGQGEGESISEAEAMKKYLVARGVAEERLYEEKNSFSTVQNLTNTKEVIFSNDLPQTIVITTDSYHLYRSGLIAKHIGLKSYSNPAKTPRVLYFSHFVREILAVTKYYVFG